MYKRRVTPSNERATEDIDNLSRAAHNTANTDTHSFNMAMFNPGLKNNFARSMPALFRYTPCGGHGVVCQHVMQHFAWRNLNKEIKR